ncbi:hypothetical protein PQ455_02870 [Sphingomonas naphthae]|uniref:Uncharacterized protein n=1 Tax=Sphingomonas naphthae TaxID=1813468 RepID=A0ABY7TLS9_9SPHN|nr:hypothetical protein [Sphingomonas naphthae]WCT74191.1 hypothetical protein PQ455_02870 [Sphingomonas naphthae]
MQVISHAGMAWLEQNRLRLDDVIHEARVQHWISRRRLDIDPGYISEHHYDWFEFKNEGWRLENRFGIYTYKERANGLAVLNVAGIQLPHTACSRLHGSLERIENVFDINSASVASACDGQITSVTNRGDGSLDIRLRVTWVNTLMCW